MIQKEYISFGKGTKNTLDLFLYGKCFLDRWILCLIIQKESQEVIKKYIENQGLLCYPLFLFPNLKI